MKIMYGSLVVLASLTLWSLSPDAIQADTKAVLQGQTAAVIQSSTEETSFGIVGDAGDWNSKAQLTRDSMLKENVSKLILAGDNIYDTSSSYEKHWKPWADKGFTFDLVSIGNHNISTSKEMAYFKMTAEYYSKVVPGTARFIVMNSNNSKNVSTQMSFLESELLNATEPSVFVTYHHPSLTIASNAHTWDERKAFQTVIRPILFKYRSKLTAILNGHDHVATLLHIDDLPVIVSGAAQSIYNQTPIDNVQEGFKVKTAFYFDRTNHWAKLTVNSSKAGATQVEFIRSKDGVHTCSVTLVTGKAAELGPNCSRFQFNGQKGESLGADPDNK